MSATSEMSIGRYFMQKHDFSDLEKERIVEELEKDGLIKKIFYENVGSSPIFSSSLKRIKIPGFRPGTKHHTEKSTIQIIQDLRGGKNHSLAWEIYQEAIAEHIEKQQEKLNILLTKVSLFEKNPSSEFLLKTICQNAKIFGVSKKSIKEFYELWGFDRVDNLENLLSLCLKLDTEAISQSRIKELEREVFSLKVIFKDRDEKLDAENTIIKTLQNEVTSLNNSFKNVQLSITQIESSLNSLPISLEEEQKNANDQLKKELSELELGFSKVKSSLEAVSTELSSQGSKIQKIVSTELIKAKQDLEEKVRKTTKDQLNHIDSKLDVKLKDVVELPHEAPQSGKKYISPLTLNSPPKQVHAGKIKEEWKFICIWKKHLEDELEIILPYEQVAILHVLLKCSPSLVFDDDEIFRCWLRVLAWEHFNIETVVSPVWVSESDWENEALHLFGEDNSAFPKIVTMNHYNVALASCYLVPTLKKWDLIHYNPLTKLALIGSTSENRGPSSDLLEFSTYFDQSYFSMDLQYPVFTKENEGLLGKELSHTGVQPDIFRSWILEYKKEDDFNSDIDTIAGMSGFKFPLSLKHHFKKIYKGLNVFFSKDDALIVATQHVLIPWLENFNFEDLNKFIEHIDTCFPKRINYVYYSSEEE
jgi:archaellum component FlaC